MRGEVGSRGGLHASDVLGERLVDASRSFTGGGTPTDGGSPTDADAPVGGGNAWPRVMDGFKNGPTRALTTVATGAVPMLDPPDEVAPGRDVDLGEGGADDVVREA